MPGTLGIVVVTARGVCGIGLFQLGVAKGAGGGGIAFRSTSSLAVRISLFGCAMDLFITRDIPLVSPALSSSLLAVGVSPGGTA
jgi:hypothetical protein